MPSLLLTSFASHLTLPTVLLIFSSIAFAAPSPATSTYTPGTHSISPTSINQPAFFILFAIIGAAMVIASIWFFFWAKNGGFIWRQGDWDDYKSTVLRRKGPDGRTLTNATKSTKLGGRSVKGGRSVWGKKSGWGRSEKGGGDEEDALTEPSGWDGEYRDEKLDQQSRKHKGSKGRGHLDAELLAYRAEQPARVGGLNSAPEGNGSHYAYSSTGHASDLSSHRRPQATHSNKPRPAPLAPPQQPKRKGFLARQREARASARASKLAKADIARARKERDDYFYNANANANASSRPKAEMRTHTRNDGPPAPPPHRTRRNSAETVATSTVFSASEVSSISDKKKDVAGTYYAAYRPTTDHRRQSRSREGSRTRGDRERDRRPRSSSRTSDRRPAGDRERRERSRSRDDRGSRQSSPRKTRSRFPPSSYNGSDVSGVSSGDGERGGGGTGRGRGQGGNNATAAATATTTTTITPRFAHPQVPGLRGGGGGDTAYGAPTVRRAGGYANRFKDSLSDSDDEDDGDLGGMRGYYGGGGRKW